MRPIRQQQIHHSGVAELGIVLERRLIAVGSPHLDVSPVVDQELSDAQVGVRLVAAIGRAGAEQEGPHALAAIVPRRQVRAFVGQMRPPSQQMRDGIDVEIVDGLGESQHLGRDVAFLRRTTPPEYGAGQC